MRSNLDYNHDALAASKALALVGNLRRDTHMPILGQADGDSTQR
jgi:hypothetical protein